MTPPPEDMPRSGDITPSPDPTRLTSDAVNAATAQWRRDLASLREIVVTRLDAMDQATRLQVVQLEQQLLALREFLLGEIRKDAAVSVERFGAVDNRFAERDTRTEQAAQESRISLDAALAAAKEAVSEQNKANTLAIGKSEAATQKQIDAMLAQMNASNKALDEKIADVKARQDRGEGGTAGAAGSRTERRLDTGQAIAVLAIVLTVVGLLVAILSR